MKRFNSILFIIFSVILITSCEDNQPFSELSWTPSLKYRKLTVSPQTLNFEAGKGEKFLTVTAQDAAWKFSNDEAVKWVALSPLSGNTSAMITASVEANMDPSTSRTAMWQFLSTEPDFNYSRLVTITQDSPGYFARPANKEDMNIEVPATKTTRPINILSNADWTASSDQAWVQCTKTSNSLTLTISENTTSLETDRSATITLTCHGSTSTIQVKQNPPKITAKTDELHYDSKGGTYNVNVESEVAWTATVSAGQSWLRATPTTSNAGKATLAITADPNNTLMQRTANVYVMVGNLQKYQIPIRQDGLQITVDKTSLTYGYKASSMTVNVTSDTEWSVISKPDFVKSITPSSSQKGSKNVQITVSANNGGMRTGKVVLGNTAVEGLRCEITITQEGATMQSSLLEITLGSTADSKHEITLTTNDDWTARMQSGSWISVSPTSGTGSTKLTVTAKDNPTLKSRTDTLIVTPTVAQPINIITTQEGRYLRADKTHLSFFVLGGKETLTVSTDATFTVSTSVPWANASVNGTVVTVEVDQLRESSNREGLLYISMTGLSEGEYKLEVPIYQREGQFFETSYFPTDECWNLGVGQDIKFTVIGFSTDSNWNPKETSTSIEVSNFGSDSNWNM